MPSKAVNLEFDNSGIHSRDSSENDSDGEFSDADAANAILPKIEDDIHMYWRTFVLMLSDLEAQTSLDELSPELLTTLLTDNIELAKSSFKELDTSNPRESRPDLKSFFYTAPLVQLCHQRMESIHEEFVQRNKRKTVDKLLLSRHFVMDFKLPGSGFSKLRSKRVRTKLAAESKVTFDAEFLRNAAHLRDLMKPLIQSTYTKSYLVDLPRVSYVTRGINNCVETLQDFAYTLPQSNYMFFSPWRRERLEEMGEVLMAELDTKNGSRDEETVMDAVRNIALASGAQFISKDMLDRAEYEGGAMLWLLQTIARRLTKLNISSISLCRLRREECTSCREISLASLANAKDHGKDGDSFLMGQAIGPCVQSLGCSQTSLSHAPKSLCHFGVFLYKNLLVQPPAKQTSGMKEHGGEVLGSLRFFLTPSKPIHLRAETRTLQISATESLGGVSIDLDVAALPGSPARQLVRKNKLSPMSSSKTWELLKNGYVNVMQVTKHARPGLQVAKMMQHLKSTEIR